ncbi:hypothetical protein Q1695_007105 [Nippostrongylus brasiliensis]|nr:hypothetical protein Q1695_007105 [Nippostrongylus brasiliensis]
MPRRDLVKSFKASQLATFKAEGPVYFLSSDQFLNAFPSFQISSDVVHSQLVDWLNPSICDTQENERVIEVQWKCW